MKHKVLYSNGNHYLIECRFDTGEIKEYVCCSYYDPETDAWSWGHYFTTLTEAGKFFYEKWEHPVEKEIYVLYHEGNYDVNIEAYKNYDEAKKKFDALSEKIKSEYDEPYDEPNFIFIDDFNSFRDDVSNIWDIIGIKKMEVK